jgi:hypothetical protein
MERQEKRKKIGKRKLIIWKKKKIKNMKKKIFIWKALEKKRKKAQLLKKIYFLNLKKEKKF